ncbi:MAG: S9 family peptidase [Myxococcales bacterium]|jgi:dipeptidyl aminopeptidase/acylaminoacyl peptidase
MSSAILVSLLLATAPAQTVTPGENLVVDGVPPISRELTDRLRQYQSIRYAQFEDWLPGNEGLLITTRFGETAQIHHVPSPGARRSQLTFFGERVGGAWSCPRKGCDYLLLLMDAGGSELYQLYRLDKATGRHVMLTDGKSRNGRVVWNRQGTQIAFSSTRRNGEDFDIYVMDPQKPESSRLLVELKGYWAPLDFSPDGKSLLIEHYVSINESHLEVVDVASGQRRPLTPPGEKGVSYPSAKYSNDGRRIYLTTDLGSDFVRLAWVDPAKSELAPKFLTTDIRWDVEELDISPDGKLIAFTTNENGMSRLHFIKPDGGRAAASPKLPMGVVRDIKFKPDGRALAFALSGPRSTWDVFSVEPRSGKVERWTYSETGGLDISSFVEPELIEYETFDTVDGKPRKIPAFVYLPPKRFEPPYPVVITAHGGPEAQFRPTFLGKSNYQLNEMGIALIYPNIRGSSGYGKSYLLLDNGEKREDAVRDVGALLDWIATRKDLDSSRVAITGGSYGGFISLASMTQYSDRLRCGMSYVGISSFVTFLENTKAYRRDLRRAEYGDERVPGMRALLERISPLTNAEKIKVPLLVIQGANDPRVPQSESDQIVERVRKQGGQVWYLLAKDEGHGFVKKANADFADLTTIRFFEEFLLPAREVRRAGGE